MRLAGWGYFQHDSVLLASYHELLLHPSRLPVRIHSGYFSTQRESMVYNALRRYRIHPRDL